MVKDQMYGRFPDLPHQENFVQCVRSREKPNADIEIGHQSHLTLHYATMSYRAGGRTLHVDPRSEHVDDQEAMKFFRREELRSRGARGAGVKDQGRPALSFSLTSASRGSAARFFHSLGSLWPS